MPDVEKFKTIEKGNDSAITRREEYAINDQPNWERFWQEHKNDPNAKPPKVNFRNKMVVVGL
jgi:hypothetical protein